MRRNINFLTHFLKSSHFIILISLIIFEIYLICYFDHPKRMIPIMAICFVTLIALTSVSTFMLRAFFNSMAVTICYIVMMLFFYSNAVFEYINIVVMMTAYFILLVIGACFLAIRTTLIMIELESNSSIIPAHEYDFIIMSFWHDYLNPSHLGDFSIHYKNCYIYHAYYVIFHKNMAYPASLVYPYMAENNIDLNTISSDDFLVISMISI